ncbi:MAG: ribosome maturation factor RimM [Chitinophagales bacterium]
MELVKIGKVLKTHGFRGHLKVFIDEFYMNDFEDMSAIFLDSLPYFIVSKDINTDAQAIIFLEGIDTKEKAQPLQGKDIFAREDDLTEILDDDPYKEITGFTLTDKTHGAIGKIEEIIEMPFQFLAKVNKDKKEILIPLNDTFILKIDKIKQQVFVELPAGFLDIYL